MCKQDISARWAFNLPYPVPPLSPIRISIALSIKMINDDKLNVNIVKLGESSLNNAQTPTEPTSMT